VALAAASPEAKTTTPTPAGAFNAAQLLVAEAGAGPVSAAFKRSSPAICCIGSDAAVD
jgi:hypothetical protein